MALIFPFDTTLNGHLEVVTVKSGDLPFPIFTFPKGSFFVDQTYAVIKGTRKLLRPGIDYKVLSCNQDIPFSTTEAIDTLLKQHYIRNAILLTIDTPLELEWHVAYCGGEESYKPSEYLNFVNSMFNKALADSTLNYLVTKHQGWGVYVNSDNTQIMQGRYIYRHYFQQDLERFEGGIGGLGWGKVELALQSIADVVSNGNDPLILDAFYNWIKHNSIEFNKVKDAVEKDIKAKIEALNDKRIDEEQFIYTDSAIVPDSQKFIKHNHLILRGIDPNSTTAQTAEVTAPLRKGIGFYSLADSGNDINNLPTSLLQRKDKSFVDNRIQAKLEFTKRNNVQDGNPINIALHVTGGTPNNGKTYTAYVVSKNLKRVISRAPVTNTMFTGGVYEWLVAYPTTPVDFSNDSLYAYILDNNLEYVNSVNASTEVLINNLIYGYELLVNNYGSLIGNNLPNGAEVDGLSSNVEVIIKRNYTGSAETIALGLYWADALTNIPFNGSVNNTVQFAIGESEKRINVRHTYGVGAVNSYLQLRISANGIVVGKANIGTINPTEQTSAYVSFHDVDATAEHQWLTAIGTPHYLKVRFSKNINFHDSELRIITNVYNAGTVVVNQLEGIIVDETTVVYPIIVTGVAGSLFGLSVTNTTNTLISNRVNLAVAANSTAVVNPLVFKPIVRGKNLVQYHNGTEWILVFDIEFVGTYPDGILVSGLSNTAGLTLPKYAMFRGNRIKFTVKSTRFVNEAFTLAMVLNGTGFSVMVPVSNQALPLAFDDLEYTDGTVADSTIILNRQFKINVTNPYTDRTITMELGSFPPLLGINDVKYGGGLLTNTAFKTSVVLGPSETKQITNGAWISLTEISSSATTELGVLGLFFPPYKVTVRKTDGTVLSVTDYETIAKYKVIDSIRVQSINRTTGTPTIIAKAQLNVIDVVASGFNTSAVNSVVITSNNPAYTGELLNVAYATLGGGSTLSASIKVSRTEVYELIDDNVSLYLNLRDSSGAVLHILECSLKVVNDV